jgi:hypothetical protein
VKPADCFTKPQVFFIKEIILFLVFLKKLQAMDMRKKLIFMTSAQGNSEKAHVDKLLIKRLYTIYINYV